MASGSTTKKNSTLYYQCHLTEVADWHPRKTVGWIEERGAKQGAIVELLEFKSLFRVTHVGKKGLESAELRKTQENNRKFGISIR